MTEPAAGADEARSPGAMLKAAREREGLHLAVLAATIKVTPAKLAALEQDRYDELPNATFVRALAQSVCRSLKIDPRPVLALLPQVENLPLERAPGTLNTPFQERAARGGDGSGGGGGPDWSSGKPMFVAGGLLLVAAVAMTLLPSGMGDGWTIAPPPTASAAWAASAASAPSATGPPVLAAATETTAAAQPVPMASMTLAASAASAASVAATPSSAGAAKPVAPVPASAPASAPLMVAGAASTAPVITSSGAMAGASGASGGARGTAAGAAAPLLRLSASAQSWIEVQDAEGRIVFSRMLEGGESATVDARAPLRVLVGNAGATTLSFRGQATDLGPSTRNNVARLELR
jgi:cytoskeleton protein RodZ